MRMQTGGAGMAVMVDSNEKQEGEVTPMGREGGGSPKLVGEIKFFSGGEEKAILFSN